MRTRKYDIYATTSTCDALSLHKKRVEHNRHVHQNLTYIMCCENQHSLVSMYISLVEYQDTISELLGRLPCSDARTRNL